MKKINYSFRIAPTLGKDSIDFFLIEYVIDTETDKCISHAYAEKIEDGQLMFHQNQDEQCDIKPLFSVSSFSEYTDKRASSLIEALKHPMEWKLVEKTIGEKL